jgi:anti-sigma factor RsiW
MERRELIDRLRAAMAAEAEAEAPTPVHPVERPPPARAPRVLLWIAVLLAMIIAGAVILSVPGDQFFEQPPSVTDAHE